MKDLDRGHRWRVSSLKNQYCEDPTFLFQGEANAEGLGLFAEIAAFLRSYLLAVLLLRVCPDERFYRSDHHQEVSPYEI